ncbi:hypothetical protein [Clostridium cylindrosporum]|uniref:Uncharacterized protein n=1 Tax=Clostridium cylindrosporum DSM 605 TaxID=1121307 RepID=A0A0J8G4W7_CLOCY|nr:hypothetical protein [Clostridium cylindrosporum]KMT22716.1 hypothetical protein CLCY_11c00500 [Clostridium cylindrosporum DSM 605]
MSIASLLIIIGIIGSIVEAFKKESAKNNQNIKRRPKVNPVNNKRDNTPLNDFDNDLMHQNVYTEETKNLKVNKNKRKKPKIEEVYAEVNDLDSKKSYENKESFPNEKKNPFALTDNPVTNAIIASEILGKPMCKR